MYNIKYDMDVGTSEGGVLVAQYSMTDADAAKVDANAKADAPDASDAFDASKIPTPKINVNRGIRKPFAVEKLLSLCMSLRQ